MAKIKFTTHNDLNLILSALFDRLEPIYESCLNCDNFNEKDELCKLYNKRPPARVIAYGCPLWKDAYEIPF